MSPSLSVIYSGVVVVVATCQGVENIRSQAWLLLTQLGEQRLEAEVGLGNAQLTHRLKDQGVRRGGRHDASVKTLSSLLPSSEGGKSAGHINFCSKNSS